MDFKNRFYFYGNITGQQHTYRTTGSFAVVISQKLDMKFAKSINNLRLVMETLRAVYHPKSLYDALYLGKITDFIFHRCQHRQANLTSCVITFFDTYIVPELAGDKRFIVLGWSLPGYIQ